MNSLKQEIEDELLKYEIEEIVRDYKRTKKELKKIHTKMVRLVIQDFGMSKKDSKELNIIDLLELYLKAIKED